MADKRISLRKARGGPKIPPPPRDYKAEAIGKVKAAAARARGFLQGTPPPATPDPAYDPAAIAAAAAQVPNNAAVTERVLQERREAAIRAREAERRASAGLAAPQSLQAAPNRQSPIATFPQPRSVIPGMALHTHNNIMNRTHQYRLVIQDAVLGAEMTYEALEHSAGLGSLDLRGRAEWQARHLAGMMVDVFRNELEEAFVQLILENESRR